MTERVKAPSQLPEEMWMLTYDGEWPVVANICEDHAVYAHHRKLDMSVRRFKDYNYAFPRVKTTHVYIVPVAACRFRPMVVADHFEVTT